jgi:hypothetical protein
MKQLYPTVDGREVVLLAYGGRRSKSYYYPMAVDGSKSSYYYPMLLHIYYYRMPSTDRTASRYDGDNVLAVALTAGRYDGDSSVAVVQTAAAGTMGIVSPSP